MIKLKEVVVQLKEESYLDIERNLVKNKADRFLFLLVKSIGRLKS